MSIDLSEVLFNQIGAGNLLPDETPKPAPVIEFRQMTQFVHNNIILNFFRQKHDLVIEVEVPLARAAPPSTCEIFDTDGVVGKFVVEIVV